MNWIRPGLIDAFEIQAIQKLCSTEKIQKNLIMGKSIVCSHIC